MYYETSSFWPRVVPMADDNIQGGIDNIFEFIVSKVIK